MRFDRGLRSVMLKPYPLGHTAGPTDDVNEEDPRCQFGGIKDSGFWLTEDILPTIIEFKVRLIPVWVEDLVAVAQLDNNSPCLIYPPNTVFSKVRVESVGFGQYQKRFGEEKISFLGTQILGYHLDLPKPQIYEKQFLVQSQGKRIHRPSQQNHVPLWAYGAQQVGEDIHPFVFTFEATRDETRLNPTSLLYWRSQGIFPGKGGETENAGVVFQDNFEMDQTSTLIESIEAGMSVINLEVGIDEIGMALKIPYQSYRLSNNCMFYRRKE